MLKIFASGGITFCQELQKKDKYISEALADPRMESWGALVRKEGKRNNQTGLRLNDLLACLNINNLPPRQPPLQVPGLRLMAQTSETFSDKDKTLADPANKTRGSPEGLNWKNEILSLCLVIPLFQGTAFQGTWKNIFNEDHKIRMQLWALGLMLLIL